MNPLVLCFLFLRTPAPLGDPFPIQRVLVPAHRLPALLERARGGTLAQLSRREFESRVQAAARTANALKHPPQLLETRYHAVLSDAALIGTGKWAINNPVNEPGILPLPSLNLALRRSRIGRADAVIGDMDGKNQGLLVDKPGQQVMEFEWSVRGDPTPEGLRFDLKVPGCALTSLEMELPADRVPFLSRDTGLLLGPFPAASPERRFWQFYCAGWSQVDLIVRRNQGAGNPAPLLVARIQSRQEITSSRVDASFDLNLDVSHGTVRRIACMCEGDFHITGVNVRNTEVDTWRYQAPGPTLPAMLTIDLSEPAEAGTLPIHIQGLSPLAAAGVWHCPGVRPVGAIVMTEELLLQVDPSLAVDDWQPGNFLISRTWTDKAGNLLIQMHSSARDVDEKPTKDTSPTPLLQRPTANLRLQRPVYYVQQYDAWRLSSGGESVMTQLSYEIVRGQVLTLQARIASGWTVEKVEMSPGELLGPWDIEAGQGGESLLVVNLEQKPREGTRLGLVVELRPNPTRGPIAAAGKIRAATFNFPYVIPIDATRRQGMMALAVDPLYEVAVRPAQAEGETPRGVTSAVTIPGWGIKEPNYSFAYQDRVLLGKIDIRTQSPRLRGDAAIDTLTSSGRPAARIRLRLEPAGGSLDAVTLFVSTPVAVPWRWTIRPATYRVIDAERLPVEEFAPFAPLVAGAPPFAAIGLPVYHLPRGSYWRLTLNQPLRDPVTLETYAELTRGATSNFEVPLVALLNAEAMEGRVAVRLSNGLGEQIHAEGLRELPSVSEPGVTLRDFQYARPPFSLRLIRAAAPVSLLQVPWAGNVQLRTYAGRGPLIQRFEFRLSNWPQRELPFRLPPGSRLIAARVDGVLLDNLRSTEAEDHWIIVQLPVPAARELFFEIIYSAPTAPVLTWVHWSFSRPELPVDTNDYRHIWCLAPGIIPLWQDTLVSLPQFIGQPATSERAAESKLEAQELVLRNALARVHDEARTGSKRDTLGKLFCRLDAELRTEGECLIVDVDALRNLGLTPASPLASSEGARSNKGAVAFEAMGIAVVHCGSAVLATGRQAKTPPTETMDEALSAAVRYGRDSSGLYQRTMEWARNCASGDGEPANANPASFPVDVAMVLGDLDGWSEWETSPGGAADTNLVVYRADVQRLILVILGSISLITGWRLPVPRVQSFVTILLGTLPVIGMMLLWLPRPVSMLAFCPAVTWLLIAGLRSVPWKRQSTAKAPATRCAAIVVSMALSLCAINPGWGVPPEPRTAWLIATDASAGKQIVLVPPELLKELDRLAKRRLNGFSGAIITRADYEGTVSEETATFDVSYQLNARDDDESVVQLPLSGIDLLDAQLDGQRAYPIASNLPAGGYELKFRGAGAHIFRIRFSTRLLRDNGNPTIRINTPEVVQSHLRLTVPSGASYLHAIHGRGSQLITSDSLGQHLEADLGRNNIMEITWHRVQSSVPAGLRVQEAHLWDLQAHSGRLLSIFQYTVSQGALTSLEIGIPEMMEVRRLEVSTLSPGGRVPRLREWHVEAQAGQKRLHLEFQTPISNGVQAFVELVPRRMFGRNTVLVMPEPLAAESVDSYLAFRVEGRGVSPEDYQGITEIPAEQFTRRWQGAGTEDPGPPDRAFTFRRRPGAGPLLRLGFTPVTAQIRASQEMDFHLSARQAALRVTAKIHAVDSDLGFVEWLVPANVKVQDVSGALVRSWSRTAQSVQVWLDHSVADLSFTLRAQMAPSTIEPLSRFDIPCFRFTVGERGTTHVLVTSEPGRQWRATALRGLSAQVENAGSEIRLTYSSRDSSYAGMLELLPTTHSTTKLAPIIPSRDARAQIARATQDETSEQVLVLYQDHQAALTDGCRWMHEATYRLLTLRGGDLPIALPSGCDAPRAQLDGTDLKLGGFSDGLLTLPVPDDRNLHTLRLTWHYVGGAEDVRLPRLDQPVLQSEAVSQKHEAPYPTWTVMTPEDGRLRVLRGVPLEGAEVEAVLHEAATTLALCRRLFDEGVSQKTAAVSVLIDFDRLAVRAETLLHIGLIRRGLGERFNELSQRLRELREARDNLASTLKLEALPSAAAGDSTDDLRMRVTGIPSYWQGSGLGGTPQLQFAMDEQVPGRRRLLLTALLLGTSALGGLIWILKPARSALEARWRHINELLAASGSSAPPPAPATDSGDNGSNQHKPTNKET
jgi:hypothetical protein